MKGGFSLERLRAQPAWFGVRALLALGHSAMAPLGLAGVWLLRSRYRVVVPVALSIAYHTLVMEAVGLGAQARYVVYGLPAVLVFVVTALDASCLF